MCHKQQMVKWIFFKLMKTNKTKIYVLGVSSLLSLESSGFLEEHKLFDSFYLVIHLHEDIISSQTNAVQLIKDKWKVFAANVLINSKRIGMKKFSRIFSEIFFHLKTTLTLMASCFTPTFGQVFFFRFSLFSYGKSVLIQILNTIL